MEKTINHSSPKQEPQVKPLNNLNLYVRRIIEDIEAGEVWEYTPVREDGIQDPLRIVKYKGHAMTTLGPVVFDLEASSLSEAVSKWAGVLKIVVQQRLDELESMRRRAVLAQAAGAPRA